jgi:hypothetical protein
VYQDRSEAFNCVEAECFASLCSPLQKISLQALGGSKVALLFLTRGEIHHGEAWRLWLGSAAGVLPVARNSKSLCKLNEEELKTVKAACAANVISPGKPNGPPFEINGDEQSWAAEEKDTQPRQQLENSSSTLQVLAQEVPNQHLYSIYVHLSADTDDSTVGTFFQQYLVPNRVTTRWGTHSLVEAARHLLWQAYKDPSNQRFILISESDIPIWDPITFYREIMAEPRSRVDAWWHPTMGQQRWSWRMALSGARIRRADWRKSAQWFALNRKHARVVLQDESVFVAFEEYCQAAWDSDVGHYRYCYSDEHYLPTLLYLKGLQEETVSHPYGITAADWSEDKAHPRAYGEEDINEDLVINRLRNSSSCIMSYRQQLDVQKFSNRDLLTTADKLTSPEGLDFCSQIPDTLVDDSDPVSGFGEPMLGSMCSLLARKFPSSTTNAIYRLFASCDNGLGLLGSKICDYN